MAIRAIYEYGGLTMSFPLDDDDEDEDEELDEVDEAE
jgi:hypothetical protein